MSSPMAWHAFLPLCFCARREPSNPTRVENQIRAISSTHSAVVSDPRTASSTEPVIATMIHQCAHLLPTMHRQEVIAKRRAADDEGRLKKKSRTVINAVSLSQNENKRNRCGISVFATIAIVIIQPNASITGASSAIVFGKRKRRGATKAAAASLQRNINAQRQTLSGFTDRCR